MTFQRRTVANLEVGIALGLEHEPHIVMLHGYGVTGDDLIMLHTIRRSASWYFPSGPVALPQGVLGEARAWFPIQFSALEQLQRMEPAEVIKEAFPLTLSKESEQLIQLIKGLNIPLSKLVLGGFSQGAVLALEVAFHLSQKPLALLLFSTTLINPEAIKKRAPALEGVPFFLSHGKHDPLLPYELAQKLEKLLLEGGLTGSLHSFEGGHGIPASSIQEARTFLSNFIDA